MSTLRPAFLSSAASRFSVALFQSSRRVAAVSVNRNISTNSVPFLSLRAKAERRFPVLWVARREEHGHSHGHSHGDEPEGPTVKITFVYEKDGSSHTVDGKVGMSVLRVAHARGIELEGACEASLACSTCHVILEEKLYDKIPEPSDDENDMLDLAFGLTDTSRLGCQVILDEAMEGAVFRIPSATRNMYVDGHVPKPH